MIKMHVNYQDTFVVSSRSLYLENKNGNITFVIIFSSNPLQLIQMNSD